MARSSFDRKKKTTGKTDSSPEASPLNLKEKLALKKEARQKNQKLTGLIIFSLIFAIFVGIPVALIGGVELGILLTLAIVLGVFSFSYPRTALWIFLIYLPFNGTITYWIGGGNELFQVSKDIFYLPALVALIRECRQKKLPIVIPKQILPILSLLVIFCILCLLAVNLQKQFLPTCESVKDLTVYNYKRGVLASVPCRDNEPFLQGVLGLKILLGYIPLIFCSYYLIENRQKLLFLGRLLVVLAIICCSLGLVQYWMLTTGHCEGTRGLAGDLLFKATLNAKCLVGGSLIYSPEVGVIRLPGTFVSPWHWGWFLLSNAVICYASAFSETSRKWRIAGLVGLTLVFINAVVCGQRLAFFSVPAIVVLLLILTGQLANLRRFVPIAIGLVLLSVLGFSLLNPDFIQQRYDSAISRWRQSPPTAFIQEQLDFSIRNQGGILGRGLGTATSSARVFGDISFVESFHSKILFELGYIGFTLYMAFITSIVYFAFKSYRSLKDPVLRGYASSFWVFLLVVAYLPYWYALDTDPVGIYYWLFAGVIFRLPEIERQEKEAKTLREIEEGRSNRKELKFKRKSVWGT
jgi:hypothetical protein